MFTAKWLRLSAALAAGAAVYAFAPAATAAAATAPATVHPAISCSTYGIYSGSQEIGGEVICGDTSSQYRVVEKCTDELRGSSVTEYGPYVSENNVSAKTCPDEGGTQWLASNISHQVK
jgi:hypothetical protein